MAAIRLSLEDCVYACRFSPAPFSRIPAILVPIAGRQSLFCPLACHMIAPEQGEQLRHQVHSRAGLDQHQFYVIAMKASSPFEALWWMAGMASSSTKKRLLQTRPWKPFTKKPSRSFQRTRCVRALICLLLEQPAALLSVLCHCQPYTSAI